MPSCSASSNPISIKGSRTFSANSMSLQTSSSDLIAANDDLLSKILHRLPVKSILQFKSVSKHWLSLISDPHFSRRRLNLNPNPVAGLFLSPWGMDYYVERTFEFVPLEDDEFGPSRFRSLPFLDDKSAILISQSCNGLLLICGYREGKHELYVFNPTTMQLSHLPDLLPEFDDCKRASVMGFNLAFDPSKSPHYKVVCVRPRDSSFSHYWIDIYSSETGSWRVSANPSIERVILRFNHIRFSDGVFWNGSIHWIGPFRRTYLRFDVEQERLQEMSMPPIPDGLKDEWRVTYLGESRDLLHLVEVYGCTMTQFDVYEMERDYSR
ncbi:hypothetical protein L1049_019938 [Liquidambar formosana]|uniref:F-box domain-containing protein n=1 Tax=Liquidambar formosana TaxID=63359 RepID=A0AAP0X5M4_LIQFO